MRAVVFSLLIGLAVAIGTTRADDTDPEPPDGDRGAMVGEWDIVRIKQQGKEIPLPANVLQFSLTFERNGTMSMSAMGKTQKGKWKLDGTKKPKQLEMTVDNKPAPAIYKLEKGELTIAAAEPGTARPKDFDTATTCMILKKKAK